MKTLKVLPPGFFSDDKRHIVTFEEQKSPSRTEFAFYSSVGIALGILAGILAGFATIPGPRPAAQTDSAWSIPAEGRVSSPAPAPVQPETALAEHSAPVRVHQLPRAEVRTVLAQSAKTLSLPERAREAHDHRVAQPTNRRQHATLQLASLQLVRLRPSHESTTRALRASSAIAPEVVQDASQKQYPASDAPVAQSGFYVEGDIEVADFDQASGTLETRDGRNFLLDAANLDSAASWRDDQTDVHYRCGQSGVCVLNGPGAAPMNARLI
jgi:hypothetical protein